MAGNEVRIEVVSTTEKAEKGLASVGRQVKDVQKDAAKGFNFEPSKRTQEGLKKVDTRIGSLKREGFQATNILGGFSKILGIIGIGGLSVGFALKSVVSTMNTLAQTSALTRTVLEGLGPDFVQNFLKNIEPRLSDIAREFGFTANDAEKAFGTISRITRNSTLDIDNLRGALALARLANIDVAKAAEIWGQALLGNVEPLRNVIGELESMEGAQDRVIKGGKEATTVWQRMSGSARQLWQDLIDLKLSAIATVTFGLNPLTAALVPLARRWEVTVDAVGTFFTETLPHWWNVFDEFAGRNREVTISAIGNFFTQTLPHWWSIVDKWAGRNRQVTIDAVGSFFTEKLPQWWKDFTEFAGRNRGFSIPGFGSGGTGSRDDSRGRDRAPLGPASTPLQPATQRQIFGQAHLGRGITNFATGGIVRKPTLAMIGEAGPEAVVPLGSGGMNKTINFNFSNIQVQNETQLTELAEQVFRLMQTEERRGITLG